MSEPKLSRLRFNFGFLLEALPGTSRRIELDYPSIKVSGDLTLTPLTGALVASRTTQGIYIKGEFDSHLEVDCIRCLEPFALPIVIEIDEHYYHPPHLAPEGEFFIDDTGIVDLAPLMREMALLAQPINPICRDACQGLCMECGQNLNERDCGCTDDDLDPRLSLLQKLLNGGDK